jgi:hypothetical protein
MLPTKWAVGITTVPSRTESYKATITSLHKAGFDYSYLTTFTDYHRNAWANWILGMYTLWIRHGGPSKCPNCNDDIVNDVCWRSVQQPGDCDYKQRTLFAMFQDDIIAVKNLRQYLEQMDWPTCTFQRQIWARQEVAQSPGTYLNLYTFLQNEQVVAGEESGKWYEGSQISGGNSQGLQRGQGALGLVFDRDGIKKLLASPITVNKITDPKRGHKAIDGAVATVMNSVGYREMVHNPSLLRHTGILSAIRSQDAGEETDCPFAPDLTFPGEDFDALSLLATTTIGK